MCPHSCDMAPGGFHFLSIVNAGALDTVYRFLCECMLSFLLSIFLGEEIDMWFIQLLCFTSEELRHFPQRLHHLTSHWQCTRVPVSPCPHQHLSFPFVLSNTVLMGMRWRLMVTCISLVMTDVKRLLALSGLFVYAWRNLPSSKGQERRLKAQASRSLGSSPSTATYQCLQALASHVLAGARGIQAVSRAVSISRPSATLNELWFCPGACLARSSANSKLFHFG